MGGTSVHCLSDAGFATASFVLSRFICANTVYLTDRIDSDLFIKQGGYLPYATGRPDPNAALWTAVGLVVLLLLVAASVRCVRMLQAAEARAEPSPRNRSAVASASFLH